MATTVDTLFRVEAEAKENTSGRLWLFTRIDDDQTAHQVLSSKDTIKGERMKPTVVGAPVLSGNNFVKFALWATIWDGNSNPRPYFRHRSGCEPRSRTRS